VGRVYDVDGMRRLVIIGACLVGLGWLAWLVWRQWTATPEPQGDRDEPAVVEEEVAPESYRPSEQWASGQGDLEQLLGELAVLRRDALKRVHRRPLYVMAEERGVPRYRRAFMTNGQLFDAILNTEGVSPETASASPATVERVRELTLQMFDFAGE
jgi:hypothetical protein